ncbi:ATP-dependent RNA helicase [Trypanosoma theileri]|uniref:Probable eukaryotic initiation factor 4A n=1 Tax=Trypanosoma theileri TaxID=67003 RepID=A0A1X0P5C7_9TRYP|nr:ATP-dependent RNA helicase [Trypanosoma theileri]ORC92154.1 ATP-dependent RNA helicase [Trypanosoma theileri]
MSLSQTGKNGTTSDSPAREFNNDEHGEALNCGGGAWRGGRRRGGRGRSHYERDGDWRRDPGEEVSGGGAPRGRGGYRPGGQGPRHYDNNNNNRDRQWSNWRRGGNDEEGGYSGGGGGSRGRGGYGPRHYDNNNNNNNNRDREWSNWRRGGEGEEGGEGYPRRGRGGRGRFYDGDRESEGRNQQQQEHTDNTESQAAQPYSEEQKPTQRGRFDVDSYDRPRGRGRDRQPRGRGGYTRESDDMRQNEQHQLQQQQQEQEQQQQQQQQQQQPEEEQEEAPVKEDHISTNPNRTQRAPHLRKNCHDEKEIEQLFEHHHQQKGVSLDNYANIPVDIVPRDVEPVESFEDLYVEPALALNIAKCGYKKPTPVQRYGIPVCLNGDDLMACAQTGSGKTAAFLVPVVHYILKHGVSPARNRVSYPIAVIMAPTRELALQIYDEVRKLTYRTDIFYDVVYGGTPYPTRFENDILVACPGRLKDIFDRSIVSFSRVKFLVLDEADRMLEMGFEEQIEYLVASRYTDMPQTNSRQTLMFSATFPQRILNLAKRYLRQQYYLLTVGRVGSTTKNITQRIERVQETEKTDKLFEIIYQQKQTDLVLIFVETKRAAEDLHYALKSEGIPSATIHGDRKQFDRERALRDFKEGITPILVATDVASRGLDIPNVAHVIQYDLPKEMDDYTHRIGRTGRAGNKGVATSFYNKNNRNLALELFNYLKEHEQDIPVWLEEEREIVEGDRFLGMNRTRGGRRGGGGFGESSSNTRAAPILQNSTWGESVPSRGRARGTGRQQGYSGVDDGGF